LVAVALGGAVGAVLRWALGEAVPDGGGFPWTTFAVNVSGCLAIGLLPALTRRPILVAALGPGLLGGYTTMSAYAEQSRALLAGGHTATALLYVVGTLAACIGAVLLAERLVGSDR
jgi:CrcB protein